MGDMALYAMMSGTIETPELCVGCWDIQEVLDIVLLNVVTSGGITENITLSRYRRYSIR